jgi:hypothetical protein
MDLNQFVNIKGFKNYYINKDTLDCIKITE